MRVQVLVLSFELGVPELGRFISSWSVIVGAEVKFSNKEITWHLHKVVFHFARGNLQSMGATPDIVSFLTFGTLFPFD